MKTKINLIMAVSVLVFIAIACSFSTANISSFSFGKNDTAEPASTTFNQGEKVFAVANIANAMGKHKVKFKVESASGGGQPLTKEIDMPGSGRAFLEVTNLTGGEYKAEAVLVDEAGKELDKKTGTFTVKGDATKTTTDSSKSDSDSDSDSEKKSDDK